jgi:hypothetical protein
MVNWVLVFALVGNPGDYKIHTGYNKQENCQTAEARYTQIFKQSKSKLQAECRPRAQIQLRRPTSVVYYKETIEN